MKSFFIRVCLVLSIVFVGIQSNEIVFGSGLFNDIPAQNPYCGEDQDCSLEGGINAVRGGVDGLIVDRSLSQYIQDVIQFLLGFLAVVSIIYIIYAGFVLLVSGGEEEKITTTKKTLIYVVIGLVIIFLAGPITNFIFRVLQTAPGVA